MDGMSMRPSTAQLLALLLAAGTALPACRTTTEGRPFAVRDRAVVRHLLPERAFELVEDGEVLGRVVQFRSTHAGGEAIWSIRDPWHHELGLVDGLGRVWRYVPHSEEPSWIGSGTVLEGARLVLRAGEGAALREVELDDPALGVRAPERPADGTE
jgi:hypothetical protein